MKAKLPLLASRRHRNRNRSSSSGVALVIVLIMLSLVAVLLVAFLSSSSIELKSAKSYATGLDGRSLNDSAVNIVISQIQDATASPTTAWASQPGMIRTYNTSGTVVTNYRLYSADVLRTNVFNPNSGTSVSTDVPAASVWATLPDQWVDLNKPVTNSGVAHYPIISPAAVATGQTSTTAMDGSSAPIQGCYLDTANTATATASQPNKVPMPVKWLYVLQDGKLATISSTGVISDSTTGSSVTSANPIVGRLAFWTDDESCKVNVNTSGEGSFADRPYADSKVTTPASLGVSALYDGYERNYLGYTVPAQNEFQRFPGHPATTSLSVIFPAQGGESVVDYNERIYGIIPRLAQDNSSGNKRTSKSGTFQITTTSGTPDPNTYRLFSTVDEFLFSGNAPSPTTAPRPANLKAPNISFTDSDLEKTRFFLTANSRSPEVNMFNKPRITLWPLQANTVSGGAVTPAPACWTAKDKLIAFCSTIGANTTNPLLYYFQRYNSYDPSTARVSGQRYAASLSQNPIPSSQSPTMDWSNLPRNQTLFAYLQYLTSNPIPGVGGSLSGTGGKYAVSVRDQILTEIVDFIRGSITTASTGTTPSYFYAPGTMSGNLITAERQVVPLVINPPSTPYTYAGPNVAPAANTNYKTKGFGRFETIQQLAVVFFRMDNGTYGGSSTAAAGYTFTVPPVPGTGSPAATAKIGVAVVLNPFNPTPGSRSWCENMRIKVTGLNGISINVGGVLVTPFPNASDTLLLTGINDTVNATALMGSEFFVRYNNAYTHIGGSAPGPKKSGSTTVGAIDEEEFYPFAGQTTATISANALRVNFPTTPITIELYSGYDPSASGTPSPDHLVQTINMVFPSSLVLFSPAPTLSGFAQSFDTKTSTWNITSDPNLYTNFNGRIGGNGYPQTGIDEDQPSAQHNPSPFFVGGDIVRSIEARYMGPAMGDLRIFSGLATVPKEYFEGRGMTDPAVPTTPIWSATATAQIHSMRMFNNPNGTGNNFGAYGSPLGPQGMLVPGVTSYYQVGQGKRSLYPIVPRGLTSTQVVLSGTTYPGDWDTGPGDQPDGPYINKPDESNAGYNGQFTMGSSQYTGSQPQMAEEQGTTYSPNRQICSAVAFGSLPTGIDPASGKSIIAGSGAQSTGGTRPWQTLLFCPNPASEAGNSGAPRHPGFGSLSGTATTAPPYTLPPDSAFLDFFTMPIVEPYAISEPFSSAGKVNMNYQIVPFTYLTRDTAIRSVLKSTRMMAIPQSASTGTSTTGAYKVGQSGGPANFRYTINPDESTGTLKGFQQRFDSGEIFRSAAEICGIYMVPQYSVGSSTLGSGETIDTSSTAPGTPTYASMNSWWNNYRLTGDNVREGPYNQIYPRLTTKSNTYTVHVWTQTLKKVTTNAASFVSGQDLVTSEYRGSYILQRYLDPNSDGLISTDGSTPTEVNPNSMVGPYKFRVVATKKFAP